MKNQSRQLWHRSPSRLEPTLYSKLKLCFGNQEKKNKGEEISSLCEESFCSIKSHTMIFKQQSHHIKGIYSADPQRTQKAPNILQNLILLEEVGRSRGWGSKFVWGCFLMRVKTRFSKVLGHLIHTPQNESSPPLTTACLAVGHLSALLDQEINLKYNFWHLTKFF